MAWSYSYGKNARRGVVPVIESAEVMNGMVDQRGNHRYQGLAAGSIFSQTMLLPQRRTPAVADGHHAIGFRRIGDAIARPRCQPR